jgi:hypothetical protein
MLALEFDFQTTVLQPQLHDPAAGFSRAHAFGTVKVPESH